MTARRAEMTAQFAAAGRIGHAFGDWLPHRQGVIASCSCGWQSTPRKRRVIAASAAYWHVLEVLDAEKAGVQPAEWSPAPATPGLRHQISHGLGA